MKISVAPHITVLTYRYVIIAKKYLFSTPLPASCGLCFPLFQEHVPLTLMIYLSTKLHGRKTTQMCSQVMS
jgi:hypothetical protein